MQYIATTPMIKSVQKDPQHVSKLSFPSILNLMVSPNMSNLVVARQNLSPTLTFLSLGIVVFNMLYMLF